MTPKSATSRAAPFVQEEHYRLLVESVRDYAIFMLDRDGHVATWNAGAETIKGYTAAQIIGTHISTFYTEEDRQAHKPERLLEIAASEGRVEDEGWRIRKAGTRFWADVVITALRDSTGALVGFGKVTRDLTRRREAAAKLREAEEVLSATLYSIGDGVLATDEQARVTVMNSVAERLTGWAEHEALGRPIEEVFNIVHETTRAPAVNPVGRVLKEGIVVGLANHTALIARDGTERPIADSGAPIRDEGGTTRGAVLVFRDVTEERRTEEERVRLAQAQEAVRLRDEFLSIASHELKTPLTALQLQLHGLLERLSGDKALAGRIQKASNAGNRLADLIETLFDVSRIATGRITLNRESFDLVEVVRDTLESLRVAAAQAGSEVSLEANSGVIGHWDRLRIEQIITHLLVNAFKHATAKAVTVRVRRDPGQAVLEVSDRGTGIRSDALPRIFTRFERAAMPGTGGLGLGLYLAREIAQAHGGTIEARNVEGGGACFTVRLPV